MTKTKIQILKENLHLPAGFLLGFSITEVYRKNYIWIIGIVISIALIGYQIYDYRQRRANEKWIQEHQAIED